MVMSLEEHQVARLRELREAGASPKSIARALGVRPAAVSGWIRTIASEKVAAQAEPLVVGCWVNPGWSKHLTVSDQGPWTDRPWADEASDAFSGGLVGVLVARRGKPKRVSVCGYLVDVYCLGVKDVLGPRTMPEDDLPPFRRQFFSAFDVGDAPIEAPLELARELVCGGIDYAGGLGFSPTPEFEQVRDHLGERTSEAGGITFGYDGAPMYISGPHDDPSTVIRTLTRTVGEGNFRYLVGAPAG